MKPPALILFAAILLAACQPAATPPPTPVPPTAIPPTAAAVESLAASVNDLVGTWWFTPPGVKLELKADGTYRIYFQDTTIDDGTYRFDNGKVTWAPKTSCKDQPATYEAYVTREDGKPVSLRMQVLGSDSCPGRGDTLTSRGKFLNP